MVCFVPEVCLEKIIAVLRKIDRCPFLSLQQSENIFRDFCFLNQLLANLSRRDIVTFHEAFPYFAQAYDLRVVAVVNREPGETLTPSQMSELVTAVQSLGNPPLFIEPQYEDLSARIIAAETGAPVYELDPVVTGPDEDVPPDYYETVMLKNMTVLQEALGG